MRGKVGKPAADIRNAKRFGCRAFCTMPRGQRTKSAASPRGEACTFVGIDEASGAFMSLKANEEIVRTKHCTFDEAVNSQGATESDPAALVASTFSPMSTPTLSSASDVDATSVVTPGHEPEARVTRSKSSAAPAPPAPPTIAENHTYDVHHAAALHIVTASALRRVCPTNRFCAQDHCVNHQVRRDRPS